MRGVAFEGDLLHEHLLLAQARALFDGALDHVPGDRLPPGLFDGGKEPGVSIRIRAAQLGGDGDFLHQLAGGGGAFLGVDLTFCE